MDLVRIDGKIIYLKVIGANARYFIDVSQNEDYRRGLLNVGAEPTGSINNGFS